jgi:hypothetical protein
MVPLSISCQSFPLRDSGFSPPVGASQVCAKPRTCQHCSRSYFFSAPAFF